MIEIIRIAKRAIRLRFDSNGANQLISAFERLTSNAPSISIEVAFDHGICNSKKQGDVELLKIKLDDGNGSISVKNDEIVWSFEQDEIEYALDRFRESIEAKEFSPAEFIQARSGKSNELNDIYGEFVQ